MFEEVVYNDGSTEMEMLSRKGRGRKIMDQKANSVADIAHVLGSIGTAKGDGVGLAVGGKKGKGVWEEEEGTGKLGQSIVRRKWVPNPDAAGMVVEVRWRDLLDAEFAETWKGNVIHDVLERGGVESTYGDAVRAAGEAEARRVEDEKKTAGVVAETERSKDQSASV